MNALLVLLEAQYPSAVMLNALFVHSDGYLRGWGPFTFAQQTAILAMPDTM